MRTTLLLLLVSAACHSTTPSTFFRDVADEAPAFLARSAPQAGWTGRLRTEPEPPDVPPAAEARRPGARLPASQVLVFESGKPLGEAEAKDLFERLEVEVVRALFKARVRLVSRHERDPQEPVRAVSWEYVADDRRGLVALFGVSLAHAYVLVFEVCEVGWPL